MYGPSFGLCALFLPSLLPAHLFLSPFRYYYQLSTIGTVLSDGYLGIIRYYGWKRVAIITQNENVFVVVRRAGKEKGE